MISSSVAVLAYQLKCWLEVWTMLSGSSRCLSLVDRQPCEPGATLLEDVWQQQIWTSRPQTLLLGGRVTLRARLLVCWWSVMGSERSMGGMRMTCGYRASSYYTCVWRLFSWVYMQDRPSQSAPVTISITSRRLRICIWFKFKLSRMIVFLMVIKAPYCFLIFDGTSSSYIIDFSKKDLCLSMIAE